LLLLCVLLTFNPGSGPAAAPTYYLEYTAQEGTSLERLSLFRDGMSVYKARKPDAPDLLLKRQLSSEEIKVYLDAIRASRILDLNDSMKPTLTGQLVKSWTLAVSLPGQEGRSFSGTTLQAPPLAVNTVLVLVQDLIETLLKKWRDTDPFGGRTPAIGDRLESFEGHVYQVQRFVSERAQYELRGIDQPMTYFIKADELKIFFKGYADPAGKP